MRNGAAVLLLLAALAVGGCDVETNASGEGGNPAGGGSHPSYQGACLDPSSPDYDCAGGEGNGPDYAGPVRVVGSDDYDLDRDGDGQGCD